MRRPSYYVRKIAFIIELGLLALASVICAAICTFMIMLMLQYLLE